MNDYKFIELWISCDERSCENCVRSFTVTASRMYLRRDYWGGANIKCHFSESTEFNDIKNRYRYLFGEYKLTFIAMVIR